MESGKKLAIFDIDGTVFRSSLLIELTLALVKRGVMPEAVKIQFEQAELQWRNRQGPYEEYIAEVVTAFEDHIKGTKQQDFLDVAKEVIDVQEYRSYRYTRDLIAKLAGYNYFLLAISHSPKEILDEFCRELGFDKIYGQMYEVDDAGIFTGETLHSDIISNKAQVLRRAAKKANLSLKGSIGVGDTETDVSFLELVEQPICFNPNQRLHDMAKREGWKVVVERKDVIYEL